MCQINEKIKPELWPTKIPFVVGINKSSNSAFYYKFNLLGFSELNNIKTNFTPIDIGTSQNGDILILYKNSLELIKYDFETNQIKTMTSTSLENAKKLSTNHKNLVGIIDNNYFNLYIFKNNNLKKIKSLSKKINSKIENEKIIDINIAPDNSIIILTDKNILFFTKNGSLSKKIINNDNFNFVDSTSFSDYILGSTSSKKVTKYSKNSDFLFSQELFELKTPLLNISIYKPYGDFIAFNLNEGAYYSMKTSIQINSCEKIINKDEGTIICNIKLTFPSSIKATLMNKNSEKYPLKKYSLKAGSQILIYKDIPIEFEGNSIEFLTKGLYSNQNILKNKYKLNVKN